MAETRTISARKGTDSESAAASKPQRSRITKRKALENHARSYFDALARRDVDSMAEHWKEDGVVDLVPLGILRGREEISAFFREMFAAFPDLETTVTRVAAGQNEVAVEWRMHANFTGAPFQGVEPTGRPIELRGVDMIEVADGQNVTNTAYYDGMAFARGAGLLPPQDSGAERAMKSAVNAATRLRRAVADGRDAIVERRDSLSQRRAV
ncbi:MAG: hypothetical protein QOD71_2213 [Thermoleophilaceae bacterium]|jgi:steroid delta-isomerase-like uncharacterized protein|nr:hypothetical protein [Thermoleophilaceae bacterium]